SIRTNLVVLAFFLPTTLHLYSSLVGCLFLALRRFLTLRRFLSRALLWSLRPLCFFSWFLLPGRCWDGNVDRVVYRVEIKLKEIDIELRALAARYFANASQNRR